MADEPATRRLAFAGCPSGVAPYARDDSDVYVVGSDGSDLQRVAAVEGRAETPKWSPDGRRIVFTVGVQVAHIWTVQVDGGRPARLTDRLENERHPTWCPAAGAGGWPITYAVGHRIMTVDAQGHERMLAGTGRAVDFPRWSPDGSHVVFQGGAGPTSAICIARPHRLPAWVVGLLSPFLADDWRVLVDTRDDDLLPVYAPDGHRVAFLALDPSGVEAVCVVATRGTHLRRLVPHGDVTGPPSWSPDGTWLVIARNGAVCRVDADSGEITVLTSTQGWDAQPEMSPDGRYVAFSSTDASGTSSLWVAESSGGPPRCVLDGWGHIDSPTWAPGP